MAFPIRTCAPVAYSYLVMSIGPSFVISHSHFPLSGRSCCRLSPSLLLSGAFLSLVLECSSAVLSSVSPFAVDLAAFLCFFCCPKFPGWHFPFRGVVFSALPRLFHFRFCCSIRFCPICHFSRCCFSSLVFCASSCLAFLVLGLFLLFPPFCIFWSFALRPLSSSPMLLLLLLLSPLLSSLLLCPNLLL